MSESNLVHERLSDITADAFARAHHGPALRTSAALLMDSLAGVPGSHDGEAMAELAGDLDGHDWSLLLALLGRLCRGIAGCELGGAEHGDLLSSEKVTPRSLAWQLNECGDDRGPRGSTESAPIEHGTQERAR